MEGAQGNILTEPENKLWKLREFIAADLDGNRVLVFYDSLATVERTMHLCAEHPSVRMETVEFAEEVASVLPFDIPNRERLIEKSSQLLELVLQANDTMNLTRITSAREAAVKHILDSVAPWMFFDKAKRVLDAGTGAGFPGIPLSLVLPEVRFTLSESIQKKARFVDAAVETLHLPNVHVDGRAGRSRARRL